MKLLLVENSAADAAIITGACSDIGGIEVDIAESLQAARDLIERHHQKYDVAIFDLQIPTTANALDEHVKHGLVAFIDLGRIAPGTIRLVWSGKATNEALEQIIAEQNKADPLGKNEQESMVRFFKKDKVRDCVECLKDISDQLGALDAIEWSWGMEPRTIEPMTQRVINIYARRQNGVIIHARALGDGMSEASVFRLQVKEESGAIAASVVGKVAGVGAVRDELARYSQHVAPVLKPGSFAPLGNHVLVGADGLGGAFYRLVDPKARSLFEVASENPDEAAKVVRRLAGKLAPWQDGTPQRRLSTGDIRRMLVADEVADEISQQTSLDHEAIEVVEVHARESPAHGDLHGENVLVDSQGEPILIDYAEVDRGVAALDPVTLELSAYLHPQSPLRGLWEDVDPASWSNSNEFLANCPHKAFFLALREWAHNVAAGDGEVSAVAYAYCIRQLKYEDSDHELAEKLAYAAVQALP